MDKHGEPVVGFLRRCGRDNRGLFVAVNRFYGFDELVVVVGHHPELRVEFGQSGIVIQRRLINSDGLEGSPEDNAVNELGLAFHARTLVHGQEPFVFLVGEK